MVIAWKVFPADQKQMQNVTDTIPVTPAKIVAAASIATPAAPAVFVILMERKRNHQQNQNRQQKPRNAKPSQKKEHGVPAQPEQMDIVGNIRKIYSSTFLIFIFIFSNTIFSRNAFAHSPCYIDTPVVERRVGR